MFDISIKDNFQNWELVELLEQYLSLPHSVRNVVSGYVDYIVKNMTTTSWYHANRNTVSLSHYRSRDTNLYEFGHAFWDAMSDEEKDSYEKISWNGARILDN